MSAVDEGANLLDVEYADPNVAEGDIPIDLCI